MQDNITHSGIWVLALIMIVIASWLLYRFLAPKSWREWAGAGLVQAFIIALFGEGVVHWPTVFSITVFPVIVVAYVLLARRKEKKVIAEFGDAYLAYWQQVPMFFRVRVNGSSWLNDPVFQSRITVTVRNKAGR